MGYIYKITNTINGKAYIGISKHQPEKSRIRKHLSGKGNILIAQAVQKYGRDAFTYEILEKDIFNEFMSQLEQDYIKHFNTMAPNGYNLTTGGNYNYELSDSTRRKISKAATGRKSPTKGKKLSPETRRKISEAQKASNLTKRANQTLS